jgi:hypothetical protein
MEYLVLSAGSFLSDWFDWAQNNWLAASATLLGLVGFLWLVFKK